MAQQSMTDTLDPLGERCRRARVAAGLTLRRQGLPYRAHQGRHRFASAAVRVLRDRVGRPLTLAEIADQFPKPRSNP